MNSTTLGYALLAGEAYFYKRDPFNQIPLPQGTTLLDGDLAGRSWSNGFEARAYDHEGKIVISFAGTYFPDKFLAGLFSGSLTERDRAGLKDWLANVSLGVGGLHEQLKDAALFYEQVKRANPGREIVFTGHSLGGGLAALMGVFFDKQAITFDPAPFRAAATEANATLLQGYIKDYLNAFGTAKDEDLDGFRATQQPLGVVFPEIVAGLAAASIISPLATVIGMYPIPVTIRGESNVTAISVAGEFLTGSDFSDFRNRLRILGGGTELVPQGSIGRIAGGDAHSISLLYLLGKSSAFQQLTTQCPTLLPMIFDRTLYANSVDISRKNFIEWLLRQELGASGIESTSASTGFLDKFVSDIGKIAANSGGIAAQPLIQKALIVAGLEYYYFKDATSATALFTADGNGIHFKYSDIGATGYKSLTLLAQAVQPYLGTAEDQLAGVGQLLKQDAWHIQSGTDGMVWTATDGSADAVLGGPGVDIIDAGSGNDLLIGGAGRDFLTGGIGEDRLLGGLDVDTYVFAGTWGKDIVADIDGQGLVQIDGQTVGAAKAAGKRDVWTAKLDDGQFVGLAVYDDSSSSTGRKLVVTRAGSTDNTITINNFDLAAAQGDNGYVGVKLKNVPELVVTARGNAAVAASNPFQTYEFDPNTLAGSSTTTSCKSFTVFLNQPAKADATLVLHLGGLSGQGLKAILGDQEVDADGATITLAEGQTQVSFALVQGADIATDAIGALTVSFQQGNETATSNAWNLTWTADTASVNTLTGDDPAQNNNKDNLLGSANADLIRGLTDSDALLGLAGDDKLEGGLGGDVLQGGLGADTLNGGDGDDLIYGSSNGSAPTGYASIIHPIIIAQGKDWIRTSSGEVDADGFIDGFMAGLDRDIQQGDAGNSIDGGAGNDVIRSGTGDDLVHGGEGKDDILGMGGADVLLGDAGDDRIYGDGPAYDAANPSVVYALPEQHGADFLDGGDGNDILLGQGNNDIVYGGAGDDKMWGDDRDNTNTPLAVHGDDYLDGELGNDTIVGGGGKDILYGSADNDELWGDGSSTTELIGEFAGEDYLDGEDGDDNLWGGGGNDALYGGIGNDVLYGDDPLRERTPEELHGEDYLDGEEGDDRLVGGGKADTLYGGSGNDVLWGDGGGHALGELGYIDPASHGDDYLDGGDGIDTLIGEGGNDTLYGGRGNDSLIGDDANLDSSLHGSDYLDGEDGDDFLNGNGGNDTLFGGAGKDSLQGGAGDDHLDGEDDDDVMLGDAGNDIMFGSDGNDQLQGGDGNDVLDGGQGNDVLYGEIGDDFLDGGAGDNRLQGGDGNDVLTGGAGNNVLFGEAGDDTLYGGSGPNYLDGGSGNNLLIAGGSGDTLVAGSGTNTLVGGAGSDAFVINAGAGQVSVLGAEGADRISFGAGITLNTLVGGSVSAESLVLTFGGGETVTVAGDASYRFSDGTTYDRQTMGDMAIAATQYGTTITNLFDAGGNTVGSSVKVVGANGTTTTVFSGADGTGAKLSDTWTTVLGGNGSDTFNADGSSSGIAYNIDGTYSTYDDDGHGNRAQAVFTSDGHVISEFGLGAEDGAAEIYPTTTTYNSDGSSTSVVWRPDGSYQTVEQDGQGQTIASEYSWLGQLISSSITEVGGLDSITTFRNASGVKVSEFWAHSDGQSGSDLVSPTDFNGMANLAAQHVARDFTGRKIWETADGAGGMLTAWQGPQESYSYDWWFPTGPGEKFFGGNGFFRSEGVLYNGHAQTWIGDRDIELYFAVPELERWRLGSYRFSDMASSVDINVDQPKDGPKTLYVRAAGVWVVPAEAPQTFATPQTPITMTFQGLNGVYDVFKDDGQGNVIVTSYTSDGKKLADMWIHNDGTNGIDNYATDGSATGTGVHPNGTIVNFTMDAQGNIARKNYPGPDATYQTLPTTPAPTVTPAPAPLPGLRVPHSPAPPQTPYTTSYSDGSGGTVTITVSQGAVTAYHVDAQGHVSRVDLDPGFAASTFAGGGTLTWNYDVAGRPTGRSFDDGHGVVFSYDTSNHLTGLSVLTHPSTTESHARNYDPAGRLTGTVAEETNSERYSIASTYDAKGVLLALTSKIPTGDDESMITSYDGQGVATGIVVTATKSSGQIQTSTYDGAGTLLYTLLATPMSNGDIVTTDFDAAGVLASYVVLHTDADYATIITTYDAQAVRIREDRLAADGVHTNTEYHLDGSSLCTTVALDGSFSTAFDNGAGYLRTTFHDATGERQSETWSVGDGSHGQETYNPDGSSVATAVYADGTSSASVTDANGNMTTTHYAEGGAVAGMSVTMRTQEETRTTQYDAQGTAFVESWWRVDGTSGSGVPNHAPTVEQPLEAQAAQQGEVWRFTIPAGTFADSDEGDSLTYIATSADGGALPSWLSFDAATRTFAGAPTNNDVGHLSLKVIATDTSGAIAESTFTVTVANTNDAPTAVGTLTGWTATADKAASYAVPATAFADVDTGDVLFYSATLGNDTALPSWLTFNPTTRTFSGTPAPADGGDVVLKIIATDTGGLTANQTIALHVDVPGPVHVDTGSNLTGTSGKDTLVGGAGNDFLDGLAGADLMIGHQGDDTYTVDTAKDVVTELVNEGIDTVNSSITYTLPANVENLVLTGSANRNGTGNAADNMLIGNAGRNTLKGAAGNDTYLLARGSGADKIQENDATPGNTDVALFGPDIMADQLWFQHRGRDLQVSVIGTSDKFTITNWFAGTQYHVEQFKTSDGKTLLDSQVQNLVDAMAGFAPPAAGQTTLLPNYQTQLGGIIAANWQ